MKAEEMDKILEAVQHEELHTVMLQLAYYFPQHSDRIHAEYKNIAGEELDET